MDMDKLAVFFAGSILITISMVIIAAGVILINNLVHRYWKQVTWFKYEYKPIYFDPKTGQQLVKEEPILETKEKQNDYS
jgi:hypothetical protein